MVAIVRRKRCPLDSLLTGEDINLNAADAGFGQTPLFWAARNGHEGGVQLLLQREDIDPNTVDTEYNLTPFGRAAEKGHEGVVKLSL